MVELGIYSVIIVNTIYILVTGKQYVDSKDASLGEVGTNTWVLGTG